MASAAPPSDLVRISKVAGRYLLFDIQDVMYIRRNHNICSVFVGTIPQNPQQNVFMGLPVELFPEEAKILVEKNVAYIVDDAEFQPVRLASTDIVSRQVYLKALNTHGRLAQRAADEKSQQMKAKHMDKIKATGRSTPERATEDTIADASSTGDLLDPTAMPLTSAAVPRMHQPPLWPVTPTHGGEMLTPPPDIDTISNALVEVPTSYPLYAHLQSKGYFMTPGLRFGCDYSVYPGDPLRFHSHFLATSYGWDEDVSLIDLVGSGRLGTGVKKGYLIGGEVTNSNKGGADAMGLVEGKGLTQVRAFCIEWAGM